MKATLAVAMVFLVATPAAPAEPPQEGARAASFDCVKVKARIEIMICRDKTLSDLDGQLADAYLAALHVSEDQAPIIRAQRQWLKLRDACLDRACVSEAYSRRLSALKTVAPDGDPCTVSELPEIARCNEPQVARADRRLARYVAAARKEIGKDDQETLAKFDKAETAFAAYRDAMCDAEAAYFNGVGYEVLFQGCWLSETDQHTQRVWENWLSGQGPRKPPVLPDPSKEVER